MWGNVFVMGNMRGMHSYGYMRGMYLPSAILERGFVHMLLVKIRKKGGLVYIC